VITFVKTGIMKSRRIRGTGHVVRKLEISSGSGGINLLGKRSHRGREGDVRLNTFVFKFLLR
jgi:hypothetical protein